MTVRGGRMRVPSVAAGACLAGMLVVLGSATASGGVPDLLRPANLETMGCAAPDTKHVFVRSSRPGNVFYPGDPVDLTVKVTRGAEPLKSITLAVAEIATRRNKYLDGWSTMSAPPAVELVGERGRMDVPVVVPADTED